MRRYQSGLYSMALIRAVRLHASSQTFTPDIDSQSFRKEQKHVEWPVRWSRVLVAHARDLSQDLTFSSPLLPPPLSSLLFLTFSNLSQLANAQQLARLDLLIGMR